MAGRVTRAGFHDHGRRTRLRQEHDQRDLAGATCFLRQFYLNQTWSNVSPLEEQMAFDNAAAASTSPSTGSGRSSAYASYYGMREQCATPTTARIAQGNGEKPPMEPRIRNRFTEQIRAQAAGRYGVDVAALQELDGAESYIFEFTRDGQPLILRIGHSLRRNPNLIRGEVDWINYLGRGGATVAKAVNSANDELVELIDDGAGDHFLATAFVKAAGGRPPWQEQNPAFITHYGQTIGRMHRLTKTYELPDPAWRRPTWDDAILLDTVAFLPESEAYTHQQFVTLVDTLR